MVSRKRSQGRALALQVLYALDTNNEMSSDSGTEMIGHCVDHFLSGLETDADASADAGPLHVSDEGRHFAESLVRETTQRLAGINQEIEGISKNWRLERMSRVDRNILRLAACELAGEGETPIPVVLNEAVELAKTFGAESSPAFVNGILDQVANRSSAASILLK